MTDADDLMFIDAIGMRPISQSFARARRRDRHWAFTYRCVKQGAATANRSGCAEVLSGEDTQ